MKLIIDWNSIFYKLYFWMKYIEASNNKWIPTGAIYWFIRYLNSIKKEYWVTSDNIYITFDNKTSKNKRKEFYPEYKEGRLKTDSDLFQQLTILFTLLDYEWIKYYSLENLEADDICFQLALNFTKNNEEFIVISRDKDLLLALYTWENSKVLIDWNKWVKTLYTRETFQEIYWFSYNHFLNYKAIIWDSSDNIIWIKWLWEKTLLTLFSELEQTPLSKALSDELELSDKNKKTIEKIKENIEILNRNILVMTPESGFRLPELEDKTDFEKANKIYEELEIEKNRLEREVLIEKITELEEKLEEPYL